MKGSTMVEQLMHNTKIKGSNLDSGTRSMRGSKVVEHLTQNPKIEASNPDI
jgi:hypothetical protein